MVAPGHLDNGVVSSNNNATIIIERFGSSVV